MGSVYVAKYAAIAMQNNQKYQGTGEKGVIIFASSIRLKKVQKVKLLIQQQKVP